MVQIKALVLTGRRPDTVEIQQIALPEHGANDVLVKVKAVALNPTDWKQALEGTKNDGQGKGNLNGCDFAGEIVELGEEASKHGLKKGDRVAGMHFGSTSKTRGAFGEYTVHGWQHVWRIPDALSYEEAASFGGIAIDTAAQALFIGSADQTERHAFPFPTEGKVDGTILIWSGASSVGSYAIQLAKLSGLTVVTTASAKNHEALRKLGADACYDYSDVDVAEKIKREHDIQYALDCFAEKDSTLKVSKAFGSKGGKIVTLLPVKREGEGWRDNVTNGFTLVYTNLGNGFEFGPLKFPAAPKDVEGVTKWHKVLPQLLEQGKLQPNNIRRCPGSLERIHEGLAYMKSRQHSHEKLVYRVDGDFDPQPPPLSQAKI